MLEFRNSGPLPLKLPLFSLSGSIVLETAPPEILEPGQFARIKAMVTVPALEGPFICRVVIPTPYGQLPMADWLITGTSSGMKKNNEPSEGVNVALKK